MLERNAKLASPICHLITGPFEQHGDLRVWPDTEKFVVFRPPPFDEADMFEMPPGSNGSRGAAKFFGERTIWFGSQ
jgi:hypothetical protein